MNEGLRSVLTATSMLWVALAAALVLTLLRPRLRDDGEELARLVRFVLLVVALQCVHFVEEFLTGFDVRLPTLLGLAPWPGWFFVPFNVSCIGLWVASAALLATRSRGPLFPIWFLAIAMAGNGVAHPLLAMRVGGYFPGLASSLPVGIAGALLCVKLSRRTRRPGHGMAGEGD